ncbi:aminotransferase V [Alicyclobacillus contaminans]|uniref:cysteine desulfurase family protein n=1 Tax=Alicyclobacillus contaminans TaxID=392016 RepID=UPI0004021097|nr:cysteine desulfurase family protein [Alicyclobacillus contaminans]GMA49192.1 aminotransferase V [Alicyclobacillus contaminans]
MTEVYFDTAATAPLLPVVQDALTASFHVYGNPSSLHRKGVEAEALLKAARQAVLKVLGTSRGQIIFTGGGTEANNLAIFGTVRQHRNRGRHLVTTQIEHPSVAKAFEALAADGWSVTTVAPNADGTISAERVLDAVTDDTVLVSVMHVNNETGALLPVVEIGQALAKRPKVLFHVDGIQAFGKVPKPLQTLPVDLYTLSAHKVGALKGVGALYVREGVRIAPLLHGGGQEQGLRSGTENVLGIHALAVAAEALAGRVDEHWQHVTRLHDHFVERLAQVPRCRLHLPASKSPYIVHASFPGLKGEVLVHALEADGVYVSTGSACSTRGGHAKASPVLTAMGLPAEEVTGSLRFSFGPWHTMDDLDRVVSVLTDKVRWLIDLER